MSQANLQYPWQQAVLDLFAETDLRMLSAKVDAAESAIAARLCDPTLTAPHERAALRAALKSLQVAFPQSAKQKQESGEKKDIT